MLTAWVTGASRGVGRGVAIALHDAGYRVFATARTVETANLPEGIVRIPCDHTDDRSTAAAFASIMAETPQLDLLVNSAWGGYATMVENGEFTWNRPFWQRPPQHWSAMIDAGPRAAFIASSHAASVMVPRGQGLIVNVSFWAAQKYVGNTIYGVAKAATDKLTADMAHELAPHGVAAVALYPGLVRTEAVLAAAEQGWLDLSNSESPEFSGRVIAALHRHPELRSYSGSVVVGAQFALDLAVCDIDGRQPSPLTLDQV